jgi:superfamily II DNA or RNA helicase
MIVKIDSRIRFSIEGHKSHKLTKALLKDIKEQFTYNNPEFFKKQSMGFSTWNTPRTIATYILDKKGQVLTLPRGGMEKLQSILDGYNLELEIIDNRISGEPVEFTFDPTIQLRPYQSEAVEKIVENEEGLIQGAPASGKTEILLAAIANVGLKTGVIVHDSNLFQQWLGRIERRLGIPKKEIGQVGGGKFKIGEKITVMMQQTARNKVDKLKDEFGFVCCDEVHHYSAPTFLKLVDHFTAQYRIGASATIKRQDLKHFLTYDLFGPVLFKISRQRLVELGFTTDIRLHVVFTNFEYDYQNESELREYLENKYLDYEDLTVERRKHLVKKLELSRKEYPEYLNAISNDSDRNNLIFKHVKRELRKGSKIILFTKRRKQCELWERNLSSLGIECAVLWSESNRAGKQRLKAALKALKSGRINIAIGTTLDEGIDLPRIDCAMILYRNAKNPGQLEQQAGRLARLFAGKTEGKLYYFYDRKIKKFAQDLGLLRKQFAKVTVHAKPGK